MFVGSGFIVEIFFRSFVQASYAGHVCMTSLIRVFIVSATVYLAHLLTCSSNWFTSLLIAREGNYAIDCQSKEVANTESRYQRCRPIAQYCQTIENESCQTSRQTSYVTVSGGNQRYIVRRQ